ncbi:MAG: AraC family transcriptional regulator [Clostridia bacterium]|nr:AraC family transcriptional regulator [Clostridia bacterium]
MNGIPKRWHMENALFDAYTVDCHQTLDTHWHSHFLLHLFTDGEGVQEINGNRYPVRRGSMILLSPMDFHRNVITKGSHIRFCAVKISEEAFYHSAGEACALNAFPFVGELEDADFETAHALFELLLREQSKRTLTGHGRFCAALIDQLIILTLRAAPKASLSAAPLKMRRALIYIHCNFKMPIKATDAARHVGYSPNYFSAEFKRETGIEFRKYLQNLRLDFAMNLLRFSDLSVTQACFESGFNTLPHFSQAFKNRFGKNPEHAKEVDA